MLTKRILTIAAAAVLAACATAAPGADDIVWTTPTPPADDDRAEDPSSAAATITPEEMHDHIAFLASDALRGRDTPSPGLDSAAAYLVGRFRQYGLRPGVGDSSYIQRWPIGGRTAPNVVAILPGQGPLANEYVVISAHMDHVGVGRPVRGDSIYNGADDNATGTSTLIEVAEAFASLRERPARSIVFLAVSGEEKGLLGSRWYSDHPTVPLVSIVANLNVDMIGRNSTDTVVVIGKNYSSLGQVVQRVAADNPWLGLAAGDDIWPSERFFFRSDHFNFARKEIPALFFFAGVHEDYHQPSDEVDLINPDKAARVARLIFLTAHAVASDPQRPTWIPEGLAEVRAMVGRRN